MISPPSLAVSSEAQHRLLAKLTQLMIQRVDFGASGLEARRLVLEDVSLFAHQLLVHGLDATPVLGELNGYFALLVDEYQGWARGLARACPGSVGAVSAPHRAVLCFWPACPARAQLSERGPAAGGAPALSPPRAAWTGRGG